LHKRPKTRARDIIDDHIDAGRAQLANQVGIARNNAVDADFCQRLDFGAADHRRDPRAAALGQLHRSGTDPAGSTGYQHMVAGADRGAMHHVFGGAISAGHGGEFGIAPVAVNGEYLARRNLYILGESAVEIRRHPDSLPRIEALQAHTGTHQHAPPDPGTTDIRSLV